MQNYYDLQWKKPIKISEFMLDYRSSQASSAASMFFFGDTIWGRHGHNIYRLKNLNYSEESGFQFLFKGCEVVVKKPSEMYVNPNILAIKKCTSPHITEYGLGIRAIYESNSEGKIHARVNGLNHLRQINTQRPCFEMLF